MKDVRTTMPKAKAERLTVSFLYHQLHLKLALTQDTNLKLDFSTGAQLGEVVECQLGISEVCHIASL